MRSNLAPNTMAAAQALSDFRSPANLAGVLAELRTWGACGPLAGGRQLRERALAWSARGGGAADVLAPAGRPAARGAPLLARLNAAFVAEVLEALANEAGAPVLAEPLAYQLFTADSLRPPGFETLNGPGPLWGVRDGERVASRPLPALPEPARRPRGPRRRGSTARYDFDRLALAETRARPEAPARIANPAASDFWEAQGATAHPRRREIPFWQRGGRRPQLSGKNFSEETFGTGEEFGGQRGCQVRAQPSAPLTGALAALLHPAARSNRSATIRPSHA